MTQIRGSSFKKKFHQIVRKAFAVLPARLKFAIYRRMVECDPAPDQRLELKIADSEEELTACFKLLHDAYVASGFMQPDKSGMRVTIYHALPTTTTLCAKYDGKVVGTISMIREGVFGFPLQSVFDLEKVRSKGGNIAEISALAVHPDFRKTGGAILFPLMKFMHQYCTEYFDTRHLVIAVNPEKIELYEALLFFERLQQNAVDKYDFANGAPAVGATLDLKFAAEVFKSGYRGRPPRKSLHHYFFCMQLKNIKLPQRRYYTTNDPVMTPKLLDHFFNIKSNVFEQLDDRKRSLLWSIYDLVEYRQILPMLGGTVSQPHPLRRHQRYSIRCPAQISIAVEGELRRFVLNIIEMSLSGFQAECSLELPLQAWGDASVVLGKDDTALVKAVALRRKDTEEGHFYGFKIDDPDRVWRSCVTALEMGQTHSDLALA